ncbi:DnaD domain protein [Ruminococcaceae bacterium OttesenSCG-928-I18]|nr:DnaD domain protein [Ruminococcaceae bacterium OttesenSCG-928-I18]
MYRPAENHGDSTPVPQLVFSRLSFPDMDEAKLKVALYVLAHGECEAEQVASALHLRDKVAEKALSYWEGAGLLECVAVAGGEALPKRKVRRRHMNTGQVNLAAENDPVLGAMMQELQHIFGGVVNQKENNIYCTLYCEDDFPADLILMAAMHCAAEGKSGASRVERTLLSWRKEGIDTCETADRHLKLLAEREARYEVMAKLFGQNKSDFTAAERRMLDVWEEEYGYDEEMLQAARLAAGSRESEIRYLNGILKKWHAKGYHTAADMRRGEEGSNLNVQGTKQNISQYEELLHGNYFKPMRKKGGQG